MEANDGMIVRKKLVQSYYRSNIHITYMSQESFLYKNSKEHMILHDRKNQYLTDLKDK